MGNTTTFKIYGRLRTTDRYADALLETDGELPEAMGIFKHIVFNWSLHKKNQQHRCLYLYCGAWRVAKASVEESNLVLEFRTLPNKIMWYEVEEQLPPQYWPLCARTFRQKWHQQTSTPENIHRILYTPR